MEKKLQYIEKNILERKQFSVAKPYFEAKLFRNTKEYMPFGERRKLICDLMVRIMETMNTDLKSVKGIQIDIRKLLLSDPLTDQQAGVLARLNPYVLNLSLEEALELQVGDWSIITAIFTNSKERREAFNEAFQGFTAVNKDITVFRGMSLSNEDVQEIYQYGIIPAGLWRYESFDNIVWRRLQYDLNEEKLPQYLREERQKREYKIGRIIELPISKRILFTKHWRLDPDYLFGGVDTPDSMVMSTTPAESIGVAMRFGNYVIEIELPQQRLVKRWKENGMADFSALYYIEPEAIKAIYKMNK